MKLNTKEHQKIVEKFEEIYQYARKDKEDIERWERGIIYQSETVNDLFLAFRHGVALGKII